MADTISRYLKLKIADDLSADAKYNLQRIDSLGASIGSTFVTGLGDKLSILSRGDIQLVANDSSIGGPGSGGTITLGDSSNLATVVIEGAAFRLNCGLGLKNAATSANNYLTVSFLNAANLTTPQSLTIGVGTGNRSITFPEDGVVVTSDATQTLTNKTLSGASNTLSNIGYSSLILTNSIVNADVSSSAAIATSKLSGPLTAVTGNGLGTLATQNTVSLTADVTGILPPANGGTGTDGSDRTTALLNVLPLLAGNESATLRVNPTGTGIEWVAGAGQGTVTSVGMAVPAEWIVTSNDIASPPSIDSAGTFTITKAAQAANTIYSAPNGTSGEPTFRFLVEADIPSLGQGKISNLTSDLAGKQATITGAASTITATDLTVSRALQSGASGKVEVSTVTSTELGYLSGVTSSIQTQLGSKEPTITAGTTSQYWRGDKTWYSPVIDSTAGNETDQAASVAAMKSYVGSYSGGSYAADWTTGTAITLTHGLGSEDVTVNVYDMDTKKEILVDEINRGDSSSPTPLDTTTKVTLTASVAPTGSGWRVVVRK
jgi:hypothetical protein